MKGEVPPLMNHHGKKSNVAAALVGLTVAGVVRFSPQSRVVLARLNVGHKVLEQLSSGVARDNRACRFLGKLPVASLSLRHSCLRCDGVCVALVKVRLTAFAHGALAAQASRIRIGNAKIRSSSRIVASLHAAGIARDAFSSAMPSSLDAAPGNFGCLDSSRCLLYLFCISRTGAWAPCWLT